MGQIVLYIFGVATPERIAASDSICTALQLAEHWQDVAEDLGNGRIYLPAEDLDRFGCTEADLAQPTAGPAVRTLLRFEVDRAAALLDQGAPLVGTLRGAARLSVAGYLGGGRAALAAIRQHRYDVLSGTHKPRKPRLVSRAAQDLRDGTIVELSEAYRECERITWSQARNFAYGIRLLPAGKRAGLAVIYAFARRIDDIGDGTLPAAGEDRRPGAGPRGGAEPHPPEPRTTRCSSPWPTCSAPSRCPWRPSAS